ncbi:MAG: fumarylacetoacetate hydrolase family protein [Actinobacteria bacterium]|nr:fumarylacetoacetate hydrolase family protein [Actinomycetota bacterium]
MSKHSHIIERLVNAAHHTSATTPFTDEYPDITSAEAYDVQEEVVTARVDRGHVIVGAKLGLTSKAKQVQMKVDTPLYGWLTSDMQIDTGEPLVCSAFIQPRVEPEVAFMLNRDLAGPHITAAHVLAATEAVFPAIDVLDSRFAGYKFTHTDVVADNCSSAGFTLGGAAIDPSGIDLRLVGMTLEKNGQLMYTASGAAVHGHPAAAVAWLVRQLAARDRGLSAGHIVLSGGMTEAVTVAPGDTIVARFDRLGTIELACV